MTVLRLEIDLGRRLIEDDDRRVLEQRPRDGEPLHLAARQRRAALADERLEALGQRSNVVVDVRSLADLDQLRLRGVGLGDAQVVGDRAVEEVRVLRHQREMRAHPVGRHLVDARCRRARCVPEVGFSVRSTRLVTVVLPEPLWPTSATVSPGRTSSVQPSTAGLPALA